MKLELDIPPPQPRYAGFGIRFAAFVIDSVAVILLVSVPLYLFFGWDQLSYLWHTPASTLLEQYIALLQDPYAARQFLKQVNEFTSSMLLHNAVLMVIYVLFWVKFMGTPGKLWLGLQVVDARTGRPLSTLASIVRFLGYFVSSFMFGLGFFWVAIDKRHQGFHDMMAQSVVIYGPSEHTKGC